MCGVNGIFAYAGGAEPVHLRELRRTRDSMAMRGPDGAGEWLSSNGRMALGHRRLAIIDLSSNGAQPMASADGLHVVSFNGEIYNFEAIRDRLAAKGHRFRSRSDTEILLHLYAEKGTGFLTELRGMFAFALYDAHRGTLLLARDPYGIKPLYYADDGKTLRFASQVKALIAGGAIRGGRDPAGWAGFHVFGSVPEPFTTHEAIRCLPAGSTIEFDANGAGPVRCYRPISGIYAAARARPTPSAVDRPVDRPVDRQAAMRALLLDSVRHHVVSDVPVGAFLSAGVDSGALVGLMRDAGCGDITTVTLGFEDFKGRQEDETPLAATVARHYGTRHTTRVVTKDEFRHDLPRILDAMDQPSIDGLNSWFVAKAAHEAGLKVAISGLGGDELLGGYPSFRDIPNWMRLLKLPAKAGLIGPRLRRAAMAIGSDRLVPSPKAYALLEHGASIAGAYLARRGLFMPWELGLVMDPDEAAEGLQRLAPLALIAAQLEPDPGADFARIATLESSLYMRNQLLRDTDWASMAHSLEVRTPLADTCLLEGVAALGAPQLPDRPKVDLANAPSRPLPAEILDRPKTGFGFPVENWIDKPDAVAGISRGRSRAWARQVARAFSGEIDALV